MPGRSDVASHPLREDDASLLTEHGVEIGAFRATAPDRGVTVGRERTLVQTKRFEVMLVGRCLGR